MNCFDGSFSLRDFELMLDCVYFASKNLRLTWHNPSTSRLGEKQKELDELYARMVDAHDGMVNGGYNA